MAKTRNKRQRRQERIAEDLLNEHRAMYQGRSLKDWYLNTDKF